MFRRTTSPSTLFFDSLAAQHSIVALKAKCNEKMAEFLKTRMVQHCKLKSRACLTDIETIKLRTNHGKMVKARTSCKMLMMTTMPIVWRLLKRTHPEPAKAVHRMKLKRGRYEVIADPSVVGFVNEPASLTISSVCVPTGSGRGRVSKAYRPHELRVATLDTSAIAMVPWRLLHISALDGASVQVYWEHGT